MDFVSDNPRLTAWICLGQWKRDPTSVPVRFQKPIHYYIGDKETDDWGIHKTQLDTLPPHKVGEALLILARQNLRMATYIYEFDGFIDPVRMTLAMFLLEIAIRYSNTDAAILLINIAEDPAVKFWNEQLGRLGEKIVMPNIGSAKGLIRESVTKNPSECSWQTIVTYMRDEYRDSNIMRQTPNQLAWAIGLLRLTVENLEPRHVLQAEPAYARREGTISLKFFNWLECENPWRVLRRVVIHSLRIKAGLPSYPTPELQSLLKQCLSELVRYNDPNASFTVAIRDHVLGTEQWETLMKSAAAHGIADANWLMAALYLTKTKFLGQKKIFLQLDTERMISLAQDYASIAAQFSLAEAPIEQTLPGREYVSVNRILAHTALVKTVDGYEAGRETLEMYLEEVRDTPGLALRLIRRVEKHYEDYLQVDKISEERWGWSKERCLNMIRDGFGVDQTYQTAKRGGDYWGIST